VSMTRVPTILSPSAFAIRQMLRRHGWLVALVTMIAVAMRFEVPRCRLDRVCWWSVVLFGGAAPYLGWMGQYYVLGLVLRPRVPWNAHARWRVPRYRDVRAENDRISQRDSLVSHRSKRRRIRATRRVRGRVPGAPIRSRPLHRRARLVHRLRRGVQDASRSSRIPRMTFRTTAPPTRRDMRRSAARGDGISTRRRAVDIAHGPPVRLPRPSLRCPDPLAVPNG